MADYLIRETKNRRQDQLKNHRSFRTVSVKNFGRDLIAVVKTIYSKSKCDRGVI